MINWLSDFILNSNLFAFMVFIAISYLLFGVLFGFIIIFIGNCITTIVRGKANDD